MKYPFLAGIGLVAVLGMVGIFTSPPPSPPRSASVAFIVNSPAQETSRPISIPQETPAARVILPPIKMSATHISPKDVETVTVTPLDPKFLRLDLKAPQTVTPQLSWLKSESTNPNRVSTSLPNPIPTQAFIPPVVWMQTSTVSPATIASPRRANVTTAAEPTAVNSATAVRTWNEETRVKYPTVWGATSGNVLAVDVNSVMGASTFYNAGYTGVNARVANIEGGTAWRGHETLSWIPSTAFFTSGLAETSTLQDHATGVTFTIAGKAPAAATGNVILQKRGIAYGLNASNIYLGNIATSFGTGGSFSISLSGLRTVFRTALITGVGGNVANRVDVTNSSYGSSTTTLSNLDLETKIVDGIAFDANTTRGATIVFSAGNDGPGVNTVGGPADGFNVLTVGALGEFLSDTAGTVVYNRASGFSSRSGTAFVMPTSSTDVSSTNSVGNVRARVDISAPGVNMNLAYSTTGATTYSIVDGTSFSSPATAGSIALLADYARTPGTFADPTFATDGRLMKAVLLNSADKTSAWTNAQTYNGTQWSTTQALDFNVGAGKVNLDQAFRQYTTSVANPTTQLLNPTVAATYNVEPIGWARTVLDRPVPANTVSTDFIITAPQTKYTELNTTLSWFANRSSTGATSATNPDLGLHNLDLEVWLTDGNGAAVTRVGQSNTFYNNTEHLSFLLPQDGQYLVRVTRPGGANGSVYSFAGDSTSDVYGLAWMARPGLNLTTGASVISANQYQSNVLIAPDAAQTASLQLSTSGTRLTVGNRLYVGGNQIAAGGTATLTLDTGTSVDVSNQMIVFAGGTVNATGATLGAGQLTVNAGGTVNLSGTSFLTFAQIDLAGSIAVPSGTLVVRTYTDYVNSTNVGRLNLVGTASSLNVTGTATINSVITGSGDLVKTGNGTLTLSPNNSTRNTYSGTTRVNGGTLSMVANFLGLPTGNNVVIESGATLNTQGFGNANTTALGTITVGGTLRAPSGALDLHANIITFNGGTADFTGTTNYWYHARNTNAAINSLASATTATWVGAGTSRVQNDTAASLPMNIAAGTTTSGIDLDASIIFSSAGTNANFTKSGAGTFRLTNTGNTASFTINAGRLRTDTTAALGSGTYALNGGIYTYGGSTASTTKAFSISANSGIEVLNAATTLTLNGSNQLAYDVNTLTKSGPGTLVFSGTNTGTSSASTIVAAGTLVVNVADALPSGSSLVINSGATVNLASTPVVAATVNTGGTLLGSGSIGTGGTLSVAGTISPGATVGAITAFDAGGPVNFHTGGTFIADANTIPGNGIGGTNWDIITSSDTLAGTANSAGKFAITFNAVATLTGFDNTQTYSWPVVSLGNSNTLTADAFTVNVGSGWTGANALGAGTFIVETDANTVNVVFSPVPEPSLMLGMTVLVGFAYRRFRRNTVAA